jgi:hypothetical protein
LARTNMKTKIGTDKVVAEMMNASYAKGMSAREKHLFKETLHSLVRLAKSEQLMEMRMNVKRLTTPVAASGSKRGKLDRRLEWASRQVQRQFEFYQAI